jgi:exopolyphosphatase/guanosine-5'-triphosphate,3'-diphosphate pyrophosphatase
VTRVAAIDCGTNSLRLLVTDLDVGAQRADEVERRTTIVRLGEGVDRSGHFADAALQRTFDVLDDYARLIRELGVERVRMVATSAARDVDNLASFEEGVRTTLGFTPEVISGDEEARLGYDGALCGLVGVDGVDAPVVVLDIGGGSTELVTAEPSPMPAEPPPMPADPPPMPAEPPPMPAEPPGMIGRSLDIGSVRLTERFLATDPPTAAEIKATTAHVDAALDTLPPELRRAGTLVGVAGTTRTVAAVALELATYDRAKLHLVRLSAAKVHEVRDQLLCMTVAERRAIPSMDPGRADVIGAGAIVLSACIDHLGVPDVVVSRHDILDGMAWSLA